MTALYGLNGQDEVLSHTYNDGTTTNTFYHLTDPQLSTLALVTAAGAIKERVDYSAYGFARHHQYADIDGDGDGGDQSAVGYLVNTCYGSSGVPLGDACYHAEADLNRDGELTSSGLRTNDYNQAGNGGGAGTTTPLAPGEISRSDVHNVFGWNGAVFDAEGGSNGQYLMRFRHYSPVRQRWLQRDPAGYMDSANLMSYVAGNPIGWSDPFGLQQVGQAGEFVGSDPLRAQPR